VEATVLGLTWWLAGTVLWCVSFRSAPWSRADAPWGELGVVSTVLLLYRQRESFNQREAVQLDIRSGFAQGNTNYFNITRISKLPVLFQDFEPSLPSLPAATGKARLLAIPERDLENLRYHYDLAVHAKAYVKHLENDLTGTWQQIEQLQHDNHDITRNCEQTKAALKEQQRLAEFHQHSVNMLRKDYRDMCTL